MSTERAEDLVAKAMSVGIVLCVLAIVPKLFTGICLCNSPKESILELVGFGSAAICLLVRRQFRFGVADLLLAAFVIWSMLSTALAPVDRWEAVRATGVSLAAVAAYWSCQSVTNPRHRRLMLDSAALAVGLLAASVIVDAIGVAAFLSEGRPGGTFGNRNFAAHFLSLGLPLLILQFVSARSSARERLIAFAIFLTGAALLLTRSRASWLAIVPGGALPLALFAVARRTSSSSNRAMALVWPAVALVLGVSLGLLVPTTLQWKASDPYLASLETLTDTQSGSGHARLDQYRDSLAMLRRREMLGVGAGNWKIVYQPHSYGLSNDTTSALSETPAARQVWYVPSRPNSDWIGIAVERGVPAALFLVAAFLVLVRANVRGILAKAPKDDDSQREAIIALSLLLTLLFLGSVDVVFELAASSYLIFLMLAVLTPREPALFSLSLPIIPRLTLAAGAISIAILLIALNLNEASASFLIARGDTGNAQRIAFDQKWLISEIVWSARATMKNPGPFPACD